MLRLQQKIIYTIYLSEDEIDLFNFRTECYPKKKKDDVLQEFGKMEQNA